MKQDKYIYKILKKWEMKDGDVEVTLNTINTNKILASVIETESLVIIVWED